ncbi:MAG: alpha/beta hydrolase [Planctomycetes bacterium]|nr:alpha/beta hydrolase [Planctomycetota bacterium]
MSRLPALLLTVVCAGLEAQSTQDIEVPLRDGKLSVLGLARTVLDAYGFDGSAIDFPDVQLPIEGATGIATVFAIDRALGDAIDLDWAPSGGGLVLRIDDTELRVLRHEAKRRFARWVGSLVGEDVLARKYELTVPDDLRADESCVVCVHGVDSRPATFDALRAYLANADPPVRSGTFGYANDEAVDRIARELSTHLRALRERDPERRVVLIGHSMGGLVCRYMLETPGLDPGNVDTLIMLGTPNQGSRLARLRSTIDVAEFLRDLGERPKLMSTFLDGLGEAGWDLWPESALLTELAKRRRNEAVEYHLILGDRGVMSGAARDALRDELLPECHRVYREKLRGWFDDLDEIVDGAGDGAVSLERGRLDGVEEVVVPFGHRALLSPDAADAVFGRIRGWID